MPTALGVVWASDMNELLLTPVTFYEFKAAFMKGWQNSLSSLGLISEMSLDRGLIFMSPISSTSRGSWFDICRFPRTFFVYFGADIIWFCLSGIYLKIVLSEEEFSLFSSKVAESTGTLFFDWAAMAVDVEVPRGMACCTAENYLTIAEALEDDVALPGPFRLETEALRMGEGLNCAARTGLE